jgi:hypothetical protein
VTPAAVPASGTDAVEPAPDLTPVPAPQELILFGRLSRPKTLFETLATWVGVPFGVANALPPDLKELEHVIAWDAPVELAGVLDRRSTEKVPPPLLVVSIGLTSVDKALDVARDHGGNVTQVAPGVFRVTADGEVSCAIAASLGPSPARVVCGESWSHVEELLPYATRGLPTRDLGANDLHVELAAEPIRRKYNQELSSLRAVAGLVLRMASLDDRRFDRVLTDVVYGLADELKALATEADRVQITARLDPTAKVLEFGEAVVLRSPTGAESSFTAQLFQDLARRQMVAPDVFWQLPANASTGAYSVGADAARVSALLKSVIELADAYLEHEKVAPALRKRVRRVLETYSSLSSTGVYAAGIPANPANTIPVLNTGWSIGTSSQRADVITGLLGDMSALLADRELARLLKERLNFDAKLLPRMKSQVVAVKGFPARATAYQIELPAGLVEQLEKATDAKRAAGKEKALKSTLSLIVVPDGDRSFVAYSADQKQAIALLEAVHSPTEKKLASVSELQPLRSKPAWSAGFWTIEALLPYVDSLAKEKGIDLLTRMPNHGRSPWLFRLEITDRAPALSVSGTLRIPQGAFQDAGSLIPELAAAGLLSRVLPQSSGADPKHATR